MTVLKQVLIVLAGSGLAAIMTAMGVWQLHVYEQQGQQQAENRAEAAPVPITSVARPGQEVGDAYGRRVSFTGRYDARLQVMLPVSGQPGRFRVVTAFRLQSGGAVPVLRGISTGRTPAAPPMERLTQTGVLLPSEGADSQADPSASPTAINLAALAQQWSPRLVNGYVTLAPAEARGQSLTPAAVALPTSRGRVRNGLYALQWWVFAAFAVLMAARMARDLAREDAGTAEPADQWLESADTGDDPSGGHPEPQPGTEKNAQPGVPDAPHRR